MITNRLKDVISGNLSGWYGSDWDVNIKWHQSKLMIKDQFLADDIVFNLGFMLDSPILRQEPTDPLFNGWAAEISLG